MSGASVCVTGKVCYRNRADAKAALKAARQAAQGGHGRKPHAHRAEQRAYQCECGWWHLTSTPHRSWAD